MNSAKTTVAVTTDQPAPVASAVGVLPGHELGTVLAGAEVGIAFFDADLSLRACNSLYNELCATPRARRASAPISRN